MAEMAHNLIKKNRIIIFLLPLFAIRVIIMSQCEKVEVVTCEGGNHVG